MTDLVGIQERRWAADEVNTSDMALVAAENALREAGIGWELLFELQPQPFHRMVVADGDQL